jgi:hypothetical protein
VVKNQMKQSKLDMFAEAMNYVLLAGGSVVFFTAGNVWAGIGYGLAFLWCLHSQHSTKRYREIIKGYQELLDVSEKNFDDLVKAIKKDEEKKTDTTSN